MSQVIATSYPSSFPPPYDATTFLVTDDEGTGTPAAEG